MASSRQSIMPGRNLTLTEELEKLEQSITLTLQEIDHNFSKAHRIVTSSIIPIVEQYAKHSDAVWEGSKFWKQFFEASANVSLSGYEEAADPDETADLTEATAGGDAYGTPSTQAVDDEDNTITTASEELERPRSRIDDQDDTEDEADMLLDSPSVTIKGQPTPKPAPATPGRAGARSPFAPSTQKQQQSVRQTSNADPLLHRILDKNYRVQATPHTANKKQQAQPARRLNPAFDSSPLSPEMAAPQLRSEFFSPLRRGPRTPGVSVQKTTKGKTPRGLSSARKTLFTGGNNPTSTTQDASNNKENLTAAGDDLWGLDSDDETSDFNVLAGMSPPKTMQFHVPQSRLMQTPAREASKRIVEDLLLSAGAAEDQSVTDELSEMKLDARYAGLDDGEVDASPSIVRGRLGGEHEDDF